MPNSMASSLAGFSPKLNSLTASSLNSFVYLPRLPIGHLLIGYCTLFLVSVKAGLSHVEGIISQTVQDLLLRIKNAGSIEDIGDERVPLIVKMIILLPKEFASGVLLGIIQIKARDIIAAEPQGK